MYKVLVVLLMEQFWSAFLAESNRLDTCAGYSSVQKVSSYYDGSSALTGVAVNKNLLRPLRPTLNYNFMHQLNYFDSNFIRRSLEVFPIRVIVLDPIVHESFRVICEPSFWYDAFSTVEHVAITRAPLSFAT